MRKKILFTAGGTGGHLYPAISIVEYIQDSYPGVELFFIGTKRRLDRSLIPGLGIGYRLIESYGLSAGRNLLKRFLIFCRFAFFLVFGFFKSLVIILKFRPDIIMGMGGYVCAPVFLAGLLLGRKIALHEQNYIPGRLNSYFSRFAKFIFISFEDTQKYFKVPSGRIIYSGNPVRKEVLEFKKKIPDFKKWELKKGRFTIVAFGGSQGASKINGAVMGLKSLFSVGDKIQVLLICGKRFYGKLKMEKGNGPKDDDGPVFKIIPFTSQMQEIYRIADIIISRAGANTVFEILAANIPGILIPYPEAIGDHQFYNASYLAGIGKAIVLDEKKLDSKKLKEIIKSLLSNGKKKYFKLKKKKIKAGRTNSAELIATVLTGGNN